VLGEILKRVSPKAIEMIRAVSGPRSTSNKVSIAFLPIQNRDQRPHDKLHCESQFRMSDLPYLGKLMGDAWVEAEVRAVNPTHMLGLQYKRDKDDPWVRHAEELVKEILTNPRVKCDATILAAKIKDPYDSTLAEMESAVFLVRQGFEIALEPTAPKKGPDIRADREGVSYFVEVRAAGFSDKEDRRRQVTNEIFAKLTEVPSAYFAAFTIGDGLSAGSPETRDAIKAVIEALGVLTKDKIEKATFYYARPDGKVLLRGDGPFALRPKASEIMDKADFVVEFKRQGKEMTGTPASLMKKMEFPSEPVQDDKRLREILNDKRKQLPKGARGIITLEVTEQFLLSDFSVENALYGDYQVQLKVADGEVGNPIPTRKNNGFFRNTSRVSAVVSQTRHVVDGNVVLVRKVYPTNRGNPDTIRLTRAELGRLGDLEDREHLTAEHAPNHVDPDAEANS
jgi:hypothetical protein